MVQRVIPTREFSEQRYWIIIHVIPFTRSEDFLIENKKGANLSHPR
jgi:hypothetical protein